MSRQAKEVTIEGKKVTVYELTVRDIKQLWGSITKPGLAGENALSYFSNNTFLKENWDRCVHGLTLDETEDLAPSEMKLVYDAFEEVNSIFFDLALKLEGENPFLKGLRIAIMNELIVRFAEFSKEDTPAPGTTDIVSS
jgi:hypothetical protein